jgi:hypothetical protein
MDGVSGGLDLAAAALPDVEVSRAADSLDADRLAEASAVMAGSMAVADFTVAVGSMVAEATAADTAKLTLAENQPTIQTADGSSRRQFSFSIGCESSEKKTQSGR